MKLRLLFLLVVCCGSLHAKIATTTRTFFDASRSRPLITTFWYPEPFAPGTLYPLMVFSHDAEGSRLELAWLAEYFAENGYIVASVDHYGDCNYMKLPDVKEALWERPKDLSHLMLLLTTDSQFGPRFKQDRVVILGHSTGAIAAFWLAGARANKYPQKEGTFNYKDPRVRAIITLAPGCGSYFDIDGLMGVKVPTLVISLQDDPVYPLAKNAMFFAKYIPYAKYVKFTGNGAHDYFICPDRVQKEKLKKTMMDFLKNTL